jgi:hypothetical protein
VPATDPQGSLTAENSSRLDLVSKPVVRAFHERPANVRQT